MSSRASSAVLALVVAALAIGFAGCGGGDDNGNVEGAIVDELPENASYGDVLKALPESSEGSFALYPGPSCDDLIGLECIPEARAALDSVCGEGGSRSEEFCEQARAVIDEHVAERKAGAQERRLARAEERRTRREFLKVAERVEVIAVGERTEFIIRPDGDTEERDVTVFKIDLGGRTVQAEVAPDLSLSPIGGDANLSDARLIDEKDRILVVPGGDAGVGPFRVLPPGWYYYDVLNE